MKVLITIDQPEVKRNGKTLERHAVKGITSNGQQILMLLSELNGDYKFPGGGKKEGETDLETLAREFNEECGIERVSIESGFGCVVENNKARDEGIDVFRMTNNYYVCRVDSSTGTQNLDKYEEEIKLRPVWVTVDDAIKANELVLARNDCPAWVTRETEVLKLIKKSDLF